MRKLFLFLALAVGLFASASTLQAQTVNMSRYITLIIKSDESIKLKFKAAAKGTPVRIVSGGITYNSIAGTSWTIYGTYTTRGTAVKVYGDLTDFDCSTNGANLTDLDLSHNTQLIELYCFSNNLTSLDVSKNTLLTHLDCSSNRLTSLDLSHNTQLRWVYCHSNNFSTDALDNIYCSLPDRTGTTIGEIYPLENSLDPNLATVLATNKTNATSKNWKVRYYQNNIDIPATTGSYVCGTPHTDPNMSRYITLTVAKDSAIKLNFKAAAAGTPVRIVSGSRVRDITVGTSLYGSTYFTAYGTEMKIYGDLTGFDCFDNGANLTALDPSHNTLLTYLECSYNNLSSLDVSQNTQLTRLCCDNNQLSSLDVSKNTRLQRLICDGNNFTTAALDRIYCALPDRSGRTNGEILPVYESSSSNHAIVLATTAENATAKNWWVQYSQSYTDIPATTGSYVCGGDGSEPNMDSYITLTVDSGKAIKLNFKAAAAGTPGRIVSGSNTQDITVDKYWKGYVSSYTAFGTEMKVYGDIIGFDCRDNKENITAIDVSHNTQLRGLTCSYNWLSSLDVSKNTQLEYLNCSSNRFTSLDISKNMQLRSLYCWDTFTASELDAIYCALPNRTGESDRGEIFLLHPSSSVAEQNMVASTNAANATYKYWRVLKYKGDGYHTDITTTGTYVCPATDIADATAEQALTLYPNPVSDVLYLSATARTIRVYDIYGTEVAHATDTDRVEVSHLPAGVYTVRADGTVAKMVKR